MICFFMEGKMRIGSGLAKINDHLYVQPKYPKAPITPTKRIQPHKPSALSIGGFNSLKAVSSKNMSSGSVVLTLPNGAIIIGRIIDVIA